MTMKFTALAFVAATQLPGIKAAAQGLCKTNVTVLCPGKLTYEVVTDFVEAFRACTLQHYHEQCLTTEFQQSISKVDFSNNYHDLDLRTVIAESDKISPQPAYCISAIITEPLFHGPDYSGQTSYNPITGQSSGGRHNRLLNQIEEFGISALNQEALRSFDDKCGDYEVSVGLVPYILHFLKIMSFYNPLLYLLSI